MRVSACIPEVGELEFTDGVAHGLAYKRLGWGDEARRGWENHTLLARAISEAVAGKPALDYRLAEILGAPDVSGYGEQELRAAITLLSDESQRRLAETILTIRSDLNLRARRSKEGKKRGRDLAGWWQRQRDGLYCGDPARMVVAPGRIFTLTGQVAHDLLAEFRRLKGPAESDGGQAAIGEFLKRYGAFVVMMNTALDEDHEAAAFWAQRVTASAQTTVAEALQGAGERMYSKAGFLAIPFAFSTAWFWRFHGHIAAFLNHDGVGVFYPHNVGTLIMRAHHATETVIVCETAHALVCLAAQMVAASGAAWRQCERTYADGRRCPNGFFDVGRAARITNRPVPSRRTPARYCSPECRAAMKLRRSRQRRGRVTAQAELEV